MISERKEKAKIILQHSFNEAEVASIVRRIENTLYHDKKYDLASLGD